jgi:hypothetical protein
MEMEIRRKLPIEWEWKAFEGVKEHIDKLEKNDIAHHKGRKTENEKILGVLRDNNIQTVRLSWEKGKETLSKLIYDIYDKIIRESPILVRLFLYNIISPPNIEAREWLKDYLPDELLSPYRDILSFDLLKGSKLVEIRGEILDGVPTMYFVVGQILRDLFDDFDHYRLIDEVKKTGAKESIEELRNTRVHKTEKGTVWDYSPLIKQEFSTHGITVEVFTKEDFERAKKEKRGFGQKIDNILCAYIQDAYADPRQNIYFGDNVEPPFKYTVRYGSKEETIPLQLLAKYNRLIRKTSKSHSLTKLATRKDIPSIKEDYFKEDEIQTARIGLLEGARTWNEIKSPATNWLKEKIKFELGHDAEKLSTEMMKKERLEREKFEQGEGYDTDRWFQKKILMEDMESSGGRLDNPIEEIGDGGKIEGDETYKDLLKIEDPLEIEDKIVLSEVLKTEPRMRNILKKQTRGEPLNSNERQIYHRITNRLKKKYRKN